MASPKADLVLEQFEQVMAVASEALGAQNGMGRLRHALRRRGDAGLARRLDTLARARRVVAHPDVTFVSEIRKTLEGGPAADFGEVWQEQCERVRGQPCGAACIGLGRLGGQRA